MPSRFAALLTLALILALVPAAAAKKGNAGYQTGFDEWRTFAGWTHCGTAVAPDGSLTLASAGLTSGTGRARRVLRRQLLQRRRVPGRRGDLAGDHDVVRLHRGDRVVERRPRRPGAGSRPGSARRSPAAGRSGTASASGRRRDGREPPLGAATGRHRRLRRRRHTRTERQEGSAGGRVPTKLQLFTANGAAPSVRYLASPSRRRRRSRATLQPSSGVARQHAARRARALADGLSGRRQRLVQPDLDLDGARVLERQSRRRSRAACARPSQASSTGSTTGTATGRSTRRSPRRRAMEAKVARFTSMNDVEEWVAAGVPVIFSFAWKKGAITGSAVSSSDGHLAVIVGFDGAGNPIVNDPAAPTNDDVQRTYDRAELETVILQSSGATVYLIHPPRPRPCRSSRARPRASARSSRGSGGRGRPRPPFPRSARARSRAPRSPRGRGGWSARRARGS